MIASALQRLSDSVCGLPVLAAAQASWSALVFLGGLLAAAAAIVFSIFRARAEAAAAAERERAKRLSKQHEAFLFATRPRSEEERKRDRAAVVEAERRRVKALTSAPDVLARVEKASRGELPPPLRPGPPRPLESMRARALRHPATGPGLSALLRDGVAARALVLACEHTSDGLAVTYAWLDPLGALQSHTVAESFDSDHAAFSFEPGLCHIRALAPGRVLTVVFDPQAPARHFLFETLRLDEG